MKGLNSVTARKKSNCPYGFVHGEDSENVTGLIARKRTPRFDNLGGRLRGLNVS